MMIPDKARRGSTLPRRPRSGQWSFGATRTLVLAVLLAACGGSGSGVTPTPSPDGPATPGTASDGVAPTTSTATMDDAALALLRKAVDAVGDAYRFVSVVVVDDQVVIRVEGAISGESALYLVTAEETSLEYLVTAERRWVREPEGEWLPLDQPAPVRRPLAALEEPLAAKIVSQNTTERVILSTYDGAALGFAGEGQVEVTLTVRGDRLDTIRYSVLLEDDEAVVTTTIDADADVGELVPPDL